MIFWWYLGDIRTKYDKKLPKMQFLQNGHVSNLFFRNKSPCGSILAEDSFWELTTAELIHFPDNLQRWLFPIFVFLVTFYGIRTIFTENQNGPCGPYEHILQDGSWILWPKNWVFDKNWKNGFSKKWKNQFWGPKLTFEANPKTEMMSKNILAYSGVIPAQFPYIYVYMQKCTPS